MQQLFHRKLRLLKCVWNIVVGSSQCQCSVRFIETGSIGLVPDKLSLTQQTPRMHCVLMTIPRETEVSWQTYSLGIFVKALGNLLFCQSREIIPVAAVKTALTQLISAHLKPAEHVQPSTSPQHQVLTFTQPLEEVTTYTLYSEGHFTQKEQHHSELQREIYVTLMELTMCELVWWVFEGNRSSFICKSPRLQI